MKQLIFATNNPNKVIEIKSLLKNECEIISLKEAGIFIDIPEPHDSLEKNASEKSQTIFSLTQKDCFSEDTGLEVVSLNNQPGVKSARYAEDDHQFNSNIDKLLCKLGPYENRSAQFRTVISLIMSGQEFFFEGICKGSIAMSPEGDKGFGYDSVFIPETAKKTFGEMNLDEKNTYSHRKKAFSKLLEFIKKQNGQS